MEQYGSIIVEELASGTALKLRRLCKTVSTTNVNLASNLSGATIGGTAVANGDRILLAGQTSAIDNGIYVVDNAVSKRAEDLLEGYNAASVMTIIYDGNNPGLWTNIESTSIVGTNSLTFKQQKAFTYANGQMHYGDSDKTTKWLAKPGVSSFLKNISAGTPSWFAKTSVLAAGFYTTGANFNVNSFGAPSSGQNLSYNGWVTNNNFNPFYCYNSSDGVSTTTSVTYVNKLSINPYVPVGNFVARYTCEVSNHTTGAETKIKVIANGVPYTEPIYTSDGDYHLFSSFEYFTLGVAANVNIIIQYAAGAGTAAIRRARIEISQV